MIRAGAVDPSIFVVRVAVLAALAAGGCQTSSTGASTCALAKAVPYPASPLMLLPDARLVLVPDGFLLLGVDQDTARWAHLDTAGTAGGEQHAPVAPARLIGPWLATAGRNAPADTVVMAFGVAAANGVDLELDVVTVPADGSAAPAAPVLVATVAGGAKQDALPLVALGSSRSGMRAGLAWTAKDAGQLTAVVLGGDGRPVGDPFAVEPTSPGSPTTRAACVGFVPGKSDLSLSYYRFSGATGATTEWVIAETSEANYVQATLSLQLDDMSPSCALVLATSGGYALAWQSAAGSSVGVYDAASNQFHDHRFADAFQFGGSNLQPPLAGLGPAAADFAVVLARAGAGEVWRVGADGQQRGAPLVFPSAEGNLGDISSAPVRGALYSTYADYQRADQTSGGKGSATGAGSADGGADGGSDAFTDGGGMAGPDRPAAGGQRYLVETTCL